MKKDILSILWLTTWIIELRCESSSKFQPHKRRYLYVILYFERIRKLLKYPIVMILKKE